MRVLVVGEGDFSLSHALLEHVQRGSITQLVLTTFKEVQEHKRVFPASGTIMKELKDRGAVIRYDVDARKLHRGTGPFDLVWFSFPFADPPSAKHPELVDKFLRSVRRVLSESGEVAVSLIFSQSGNAQFDRWSEASHHPHARITCAFWAYTHLNKGILQVIILALHKGLRLICIVLSHTSLAKRMLRLHPRARCMCVCFPQASKTQALERFAHSFASRHTS
jgi:hypothetical protein